MSKIIKKKNNNNKHKVINDHIITIKRFSLSKLWMSHFCKIFIIFKTSKVN